MLKHILQAGRYLPCRKLLSTGIVSIFGLSLPLNLSATVYYFSVTGNDGNTGISISAPKKSLDAAAALAIPGNSLLFKRGDAWYSPFHSFDLRNKSGTERNEINIGAYGSGPRPVIACMDLLDQAGWTHIPGTTRWKHPVAGYSRALRLFINGVSKYRVNTTDSSVDETGVDQPYEWFIKEYLTGRKGAVYVNNGSAISAPVNVEVLPENSVTVLIMQHTNYVTVRNIDFRGGSAWNIIHIEAPAAHICFDSCIIQRGNGSGIQAENTVDKEVSAFVSQLTISRCLIDKVWSAHENDPKIRLSGDGIFLRHAVDQGLLDENRILNWGHSGISLTSYALGVHGVHHIIVQRNDVSAGESGYMHAIDMNGFEGLTTHNIVRRNYFHDYLVTGHILGSFNLIYSNIFAGVKISRMPLHSHQGWAVDWYPWPYRGNGPWIEAHDNDLINNTFSDAEEFLIMVNDDPANPNPVTRNTIANNIFYQFGSLAINVSEKVKGSIPVKSNDFWNFDSSGIVARYKNPTREKGYTALKLNQLFPDVCANNIQMDPVFADPLNRDFRLTSRSPEKIKRGGNNEYLALLDSGFVDFYGNAWNTRYPSMGAIQYTESTRPVLPAGKRKLRVATQKMHAAGSYSQKNKINNQ